MNEPVTWWFAGPTFMAALASTTLAAIVYRKSAQHFERAVAAVLTCTAMMQLAAGLDTVDPSHRLLWRRAALLALLWLTASLLEAGIALAGEAPKPPDGHVRTVRLTLVGGLCLLSSLAWPALALDVQDTPAQVLITPLGRGFLILILVGLIAGLARVEGVVRSLRDPERYRLKFVLIGLGALGGFQIYLVSRYLLAADWERDHVFVDGLASLLSVGLIAYGLGRSRFQQLSPRIYVAPAMLFRSFTVLTIGLYVVAVGGLTHVLQLRGGLRGSLSAFLVFVAVIALVVLISSRHVRSALRQFVLRHFYRAKYDYREKWLDVTSAFKHCDGVESILDQLLALLSRTFGAERISIWLRYEADGQFHQVRSTNIEPASPLAPDDPLLVSLQGTETALEAGRRRGEYPPASFGKAFLEHTHAAVCVPIRFDKEMIAFVALSGDPRGERYGPDDWDLLRAITQHTAVLLAHALLAEERRAAAELEALHRLSAFCLHDLKNLAARLSLVLQNARVHGQDPAFQHAALRTVAETAKRMTALLTKLGLQAGQQCASPAAEPSLTDVNALIADTTTTLGQNGRIVRGAADPSLPLVPLPYEPLQQVLLNVVLNAQQACGPRGHVTIEAHSVNGCVVISVADTGPGIPPALLRTIFQPCMTTKSDGLGVGLYECKRIVESFGGSISLQTSCQGGTRVSISLPVAETTVSMQGGCT